MGSGSAEDGRKPLSRSGLHGFQETGSREKAGCPVGIQGLRPDSGPTGPAPCIPGPKGPCAFSPGAQPCLYPASPFREVCGGQRLRWDTCPASLGALRDTGGCGKEGSERRGPASALPSTLRHRCPQGLPAPQKSLTSPRLPAVGVGGT